MPRCAPFLPSIACRSHLLDAYALITQPPPDPRGHPGVLLHGVIPTSSPGATSTRATMAAPCRPAPSPAHTAQATPAGAFPDLWRASATLREPSAATRSSPASLRRHPLPPRDAPTATTVITIAGSSPLRELSFPLSLLYVSLFYYI